jgi:hypothetical protein
MMVTVRVSMYALMFVRMALLMAVGMSRVGQMGVNQSAPCLSRLI